MSGKLTISIGQHSDKGRKEVNQDFHGALVPVEPLLSAKGVAIALADGISSSAVSQEASEAAVRSFLEDYYCTSDAWSVKRSGQRVLGASNAWLHGQTQRSPHRNDQERGYVCTFSAMVIKSTTAHLFHVGDSRILRLHPKALEQLTEDHRVRISSQQSYLARALGAQSTVDIDYLALPLTQGEVYVLATDGVHEHVDAALIHATLQAHPDDLDAAARSLVEAALERGSQDNLTVQLVRIDALPAHDITETSQRRAALALPPLLTAREQFDGYRIVRELHASSRSHIYLAIDEASGQQVALKIPSVDQHADPACLERFLMEEWIARRIDSPHVLKPCAPTRTRQYLYVVMEYVEGQTLAQWMQDNPKPDLPTVRRIVEQIGRGLQAFHRMDMLHQDLRPANIMIDATATVKIIDFGSTRVAGLAEATAPLQEEPLLGTAQYTAPEYFLGESGSARSDLFSLGVITYQMLTSRLPYGSAVAATRTPANQRRLVFDSTLASARPLPVWVDGALRKALHPDPWKRHEDVAEFVYDLQHPNSDFLHRQSPPLIERHPLAFWKALSFLLLIAVMSLAYRLAQTP
ncbi:bifunctional protein-serine/threonine kinase/phosphatase [Hydrogenophaga sp. PAMC20947]|uniref:bifunctional protein-serine/threonine kinase/phosphatase n=1 Tax=Hydrogenophaga sp. PAMC20947 TaxID=2565558 RepID=UPI00109E2C51|nr:bifunctional protein-serine/threonine kinase/phosphatase [Hydrogenophaga sp. PAMC20947]QCB45734.1 bifunctional protein-serine/threonine kinase/phosphatase [Hydrogenophaga sp. PAMC20947]